MQRGPSESVSIVPVLVDDDGQVIAVGDAKDTIPTALRRALIVRDGRCRFPGCRAPVAWCDAHHIIPREDHGPTELWNLLLLCRRCHTRVHRKGWKLKLHDDGRLTVTRGRWTATSFPRAGP